MYAIRYRNRWITIHKNCWNTIGNAKYVMEIVWFAANQTVLHHKRKILPNQQLQPTATRDAACLRPSLVVRRLNIVWTRTGLW